MEKATKLLHLLTMILLFITGFYIQHAFQLLLTNSSLLLIWILISVLALLHLEFTFRIVRRRLSYFDSDMS
ncbi:MAG: hypothetical protein DWP97_12825 [Calditrichaeota bacterium]|nr:MAG: hypothetical protein DWP97_12825 [Calditrichota bacterium]